MKTKLLAIVAAVAITAGTAGIATSANAASPIVPAASVHIDLGGLLGFHYGHPHHRGYRHRRMCRRLYIRGFRYGSPRARYLWRRYCRWY